MAKQFDPNEDFDTDEDPFADLESEFDVDDLDDLGDPFEGAGGGGDKKRRKKDKSARTPVRSLEDFEDEVDANIKRLMSAKNVDANERRKIAYWLGESGSPKAITSLALVYKRDKKNKSVQQAAAYALGQFKALDEAIEREPDEPVAEALTRSENAYLVEMLTDVALYDDRGKRLRVRPRVLALLMLLLVLTLGGLIAAYLVIEPKDRPLTAQVADATGRSAQDVYDLLTGGVTAARADETALRGFFQSGTPLNCEITLQTAQGINANSAFQTTHPALWAALESYNPVVEQLTTARGIFEGACRAAAAAASSGDAGSVVPLTDENRTAATTALDSAAGALTALEAALPAIQDEINTAATAAAETATAAALTAAVTEAPPITPTDAPTATETPGLSAQELNAQIVALQNLIDGALSTRGYAALLKEYWQNIRDFNTLDVCQVAEPVIPEDYVLPEDVLPFAPPALIDAVQQVNVGLQASRDGWSVFRSACNSGNAQARVEIGLATVTLAETAFNTANGLLQNAR